MISIEQRIDNLEYELNRLRPLKLTAKGREKAIIYCCQEFAAIHNLGFIYRLCPEEGLLHGLFLYPSSISVHSEWTDGRRSIITFNKTAFVIKLDEIESLNKCLLSIFEHAEKEFHLSPWFELSHDKVCEISRINNNWRHTPDEVCEISRINNNWRHTPDIRVNVESLYPNTLIRQHIAETAYSPEWKKIMKERLNNKFGLKAATSNNKLPEIERVIFNKPATIVFWSDGTKTVVKAQGDDPYDREKGLAMAISKKALGNDSGYYDTFKKAEKDYMKDLLSNIDEMHLHPDKATKALANVVKAADKYDKALGVAVGYVTPCQLAALVGVSDNRIREQCRKGEFTGAKKVNGKWLIPYYEHKYGKKEV